MDFFDSVGGTFGADPSAVHTHQNPLRTLDEVLMLVQTLEVCLAFPWPTLTRQGNRSLRTQ